MIQRMTLGATPCDEQCAQVGDDNYACIATAECAIYIGQLWRILERKKQDYRFPSHDNFQLRIASHSHDFGTYYEVDCVFDNEDDLARDLAYWLEENLPAHWDNEALRELERH